MKVYEGAILTCDANDQVARYLVEDGGRILYVGDELPERYISVRHERLGKKALIPAFTDSHIHFASFSTFHAGLNVMNAASNEEILSVHHPIRLRKEGLSTEMSWTGFVRINRFSWGNMMDMPAL